MAKFKNLALVSMAWKSFIFTILFSPNILAKERDYGSICLGPNLSKVWEITWVKVDASKKFKNPSNGRVELILNHLDLLKKHTVTVFVKSKLTDEKVIKGASWSFKFKKNGTHMVSIFRSSGGWQLFQNKIAKCEFPISGCQFDYICK